ncbi:MAG: hypothetical protein ACLFS7_06590, partial [Desulfosudaceae bacterium]
MTKPFSQICPDFEEWPERWMGTPEDIPFGEKIIHIFRPFIADLLHAAYTDKTIRRHIDNLWLLGGEIVREINMAPDLRNTDARDLLMETIGDHGGQPCRHLSTDAEQR